MNSTGAAPKCVLSGAWADPKRVLSGAGSQNICKGSGGAPGQAPAPQRFAATGQAPGQSRWDMSNRSGANRIWIFPIALRYFQSQRGISNHSWVFPIAVGYFHCHSGILLLLGGGFCVIRVCNGHYRDIVGIFARNRTEPGTGIYVCQEQNRFCTSNNIFLCQQQCILCLQQCSFMSAIMYFYIRNNVFLC